MKGRDREQEAGCRTGGAERAFVRKRCPEIDEREIGWEWYSMDAVGPRSYGSTSRTSSQSGEGKRPVRPSRVRGARIEEGEPPLSEGQPLPADADNVVYVVDDDPSVRRSLGRLIRAAGFHVATFPSAQAFLEQPLPEQTACLIVDVRLPGPSGLDLQAILARAEHATPIIFLTGFGNVPMGVQAMKDGAVDFLEKPFDETELLGAVERALSRCRQTRSERAERTLVQQRFNTLTPRERQVLGLVVAGLLNKQIAAHLSAAEKTIKIHRGRVMRKMQADSVADLVRMTQRIGVEPAKA